MLSRDDVLVVVVGAGASHGCLPTYLQKSNVLEPIRGATGAGLAARPYGQVLPPVTQDLVAPTAYVNELLEFYPAALPLVGALRSALVGQSNPIPLEEALAGYQSLEGGNPEIRREVLAFRFFLRDLLTQCNSYMRSPDLGAGETNYVNLVRELRHWARRWSTRLCFVSFNYDTLLEEAIRIVFDFDSRDPNAFLSPDSVVAVLKPHGSTMWERRYREAGMMERQEAVRQVLYRDERLGGVFGAPQLAQPAFAAEVQPAEPYLALPLTGKGELLWPEEQAAFLASLEGRVRRVLSIGWRAAEDQFLHQLGRLGDGVDRILCCSVGQAAEVTEIARRIARSVYRRSSYPAPQALTSGFAGLLDAEEFNQWLLG